MSLTVTEIDQSRAKADAPVAPTKEQLARRRSRSVALAIALGLLVILFYAVTIVKIGGNIAARPL